MRRLGKWWIWLVVGSLFPYTLVAQDLQPQRLSEQSPLSVVPEYAVRHPFYITLVEVGNSMPLSFRDTLENTLLRPEKLYPFFDRLVNNESPVRILHLGDSHVRGHVFTVTTRHRLEQAWGSYAVVPDSITYRTSALAVETGAPGLVYHTLGINGATTVNFRTPEKLAALDSLRPDLVILSFGTNESHGSRYSEKIHRMELDSMLHAVNTYCPKAEVLLTTPPGSYLRRRRRQRVINPTTPRVADAILAFANQKELPVWDLYHIAGGSRRACANWVNNKYMQRDRVHYTHDGYRLQGVLLAEAILKAYNGYVENRFD